MLTKYREIKRLFQLSGMVSAKELLDAREELQQLKRDYKLQTDYWCFDLEKSLITNRTRLSSVGKTLRSRSANTRTIGVFSKMKYGVSLSNCVLRHIITLLFALVFKSLTSTFQHA
ncbi:hypothetical protein GQ600_19718 [Phytophthora cactorum]|nr:hypothetical protein GQ600_19718 [Phytophthora cactorum]